MKVRSFSSAKTEDIHDYTKSAKRDFDPNNFILHVGKNNVSTNNSREMIADKIVKFLKTENNNFILSVIVPSGNKLNQKTEKVNNLLEKPCNQNQIDLAKNSNMNIKRHLNRSKLHLNSYRKSIFIQNIRNYLTNFKWRDLQDNMVTLFGSLSLNHTLFNNDLLKSKNNI